ncbi:MAG: hypothetical protein ABEI32_15455 [Halothece sp.]
MPNEPIKYFGDTDNPAPQLPNSPRDIDFTSAGKSASYRAGSGNWKLQFYESRASVTATRDQSWETVLNAPLWVDQVKTIGGPIAPRQKLNGEKMEGFTAYAVRLGGWLRMPMRLFISHIENKELLHMSVRAFPSAIEFHSEVEFRVWSDPNNPNNQIVSYRQGYPLANWVTRLNLKIESHVEKNETENLLASFCERLDARSRFSVQNSM